MNPESCSLYEKCECPSCPLDRDNSIWYSEDEICKNPDFHIISNSMNKLKRKAAPGYFTLQMLNRDFFVRKGTEGIDPDIWDSVKDSQKEYERKEKTWLKEHPEISRERKEKMRIFGLKYAKSTEEMREMRTKQPKFIQNPPFHPSVSEMIDPKGIITRPDPQSPQKSLGNGGSEKNEIDEDL